MKISAGLLGVALGQGSGDSDDYTYTYDSVDADAGAAEKSDGYNNGYNSGYNFNEASYSSDPYNQGYYGRAAVNAYELSCWNSNSMRDFNHDNKFAAPGDTIIGSTVGGLHHQYGYENGNYAPGTKFDSSTMEYGSDTNLYGSIETGNSIDIADDTHAVDAVSPHKWGYQNSNPDAKYHYGHHVANAGSNRGYGPQAATAYHGFVADDWRYSLRHSGCLYEVQDYTYDAASYAKTSKLTHTAGTGGHPHWVHVFNAHIYPSSANTISTFHVVMANPVYEGLGYFNFVATYADTAISTSGFTQDPFASTYGGAARYSVAKGTWTLDETTGLSWKLGVVGGEDAPTFAAAGAAAGGVAISSFPHNQLGADFRFNLRTLHTMGHGLQDASAANTADSYFWYAVNKITITFPHFVSETDSCHGLRSGAVADYTTVDCTGHVHDIIVDENIEVTGVTGGNQGSPIARLSGAVSGGCGASPVYGPSKTVNYQCASFCQHADISCGKTLTISNIMSTYDEFHLRQYGTIQEIWAQLQYAYTQTVDKDSAVATGFESPMPNVFFSAAQVNSIVLSCDSSSSEKCKGYTRAQNMPYAGDATETNRWTNVDADISNGDARGDAFWVNNNDN